MGPQCSSANQSPINLSQSSAKPCNLSCDLVMDNGEVPKAIVVSTPFGLGLGGNLGSCKFRGESYVCQMLMLSHPSHHTIEGVQADAEIVAIFRKPTGEKLMLSSLIRITGTQTPSYFFFKQFVPYVGTTDTPTPVSLKEWSISAMVPAEASYYVYAGSSLIPPCEPAEWVVFKSMINMDQGDFAYLVRNVQAGSRPIQNLGQREVFFNDTNNVPGGPMPHDGKFYLRLKPTGDTKVADLKPKQVDLTKDKKNKKEIEEEQDSTVMGQSQKSVNEYIEKYGWAGIILGAIAIIGIMYGAYYGYQGSKEKPLTGESMKPIAVWTRDTSWWIVLFFYNCFVWVWNKLGMVFGFIVGPEKAIGQIENAAGDLAESAAKQAKALTDVAVAESNQTIKALSTPQFSST